MTRYHFVLLLLTLIACESRAYAGCPNGVCVVPAGGDLQAAFNTAVGGDVIELQAGATFTGHYDLPAHSGASFVTVTTTGTVAAPIDVLQLCYQQGPTFAAEMSKKAACKAALIAQYAGAPKIVTPDTRSAVSTLPGADYWKFVGIEIATSLQARGNGCAPTYSIVALGLNDGFDVRSVDDLPEHIVFDRVYIHGNPVGCSRRAILAQATHFEFINSVCTEIHESGQDSQCVMAYNSPGPFVIRNNFGEAAGENVIFGGADPPIAGLIPSDIEISGNYFSKDWGWWPNAHRVGFTHTGANVEANWQVKNVLECKNCQRMKVFANVLEASWEYNQSGNIVLFQSLAQDGKCSWCVVRDIEMFGNVIRHGGVGLTVLGKGGAVTMGRRINFHDNLLYGISSQYSLAETARGDCYILLSGSSSGEPFDGLSINHNTCDNEGGVAARIGNSGDKFSNFVFTNNLSRSREWYDAQFTFDTLAGGLVGFRGYMGESFTVTNNVFAADGGHTEWPHWNEFLTASAWNGMFADPATGDYRLNLSSPYKAGRAKQATDGKDLGVDFAVLLSRVRPTSDAPSPGSPKGLRIVP